MANETFRVGEIAIAQNWTGAPHYNGTEVAVIAPLAERSSFRVSNGQVVVGPAYLVRCLDGAQWTAAPRLLRKRRPPQDWVKLCNLHDIPLEVSHV